MIRFFGDFTRFFRDKLFRLDRVRSYIGILFIGLICFNPATQPYGAVLGGWFLMVCVINIFADYTLDALNLFNLPHCTNSCFCIVVDVFLI